ncbi:MAG: TrmH family RNA methyltransferase [Microbacterium gubbeenense]|uniref:TrmH family RNA methyltransferase n=1 Tax=Microbacterium gubbeenense TaxID=159896 RepID=UPI0003FFA0B4|nr:RNA methyltransferase [Microbacterium gubbeenense]
MHLERIDDAGDERIADYRSLTDVALRRKLEPEGGLYMAESAKVLARALAAGHAPRSVLTAEKWLPDIERIVGDRDVPVYVVADDVAEAVTGYAVHRGMLAAMHRPELPSVADVLSGARTALVLDGLVDHANVGAAFRGAAGLGADAVLVTPRCADPLYRRSVRVSMGTVFQVPWTRLPEWNDGAADEMHASGMHIAAMALADDAVPLDEFVANRPERVAFLMGSEGPGLDKRALAAADTKVVIPMSGGVDSLNVAAASAVALWALR